MWYLKNIFGGVSGNQYIDSSNWVGKLTKSYNQHHQNLNLGLANRNLSSNVNTFDNTTITANSTI
jgi:hypothetical protein